MSQTSNRGAAACAGALMSALALSVPAAAQESVTHPGLAATTPAVGEVPAPRDAASPAENRLVSDDVLGGESGKGATVAITDQDLTAITTGNTIAAAQVSSGAISLSDSALSGFGGIGNFLMNTGHNNSLQSNVSVTIIVTQ